MVFLTGLYERDQDIANTVALRFSPMDEHRGLNDMDNLIEVARPALEALRLLRLRLRLGLAGGTWPGYKGFLLHGALGATLSRLSPTAYAELMGGNDEAPGRGFVLLPPLDASERYLPGSELDLELTLFGDAVRWAPICLLALQHMGRQGLGRGEARFDLMAAESLAPAGTRLVYAPASGLSPAPEPITAWSVLAAAPAVTCRNLVLELPSPLRLKADNRLVRNAPSFPLFFQRLLGRLAILSRSCGGSELPPAVRTGLSAASEQVELAGHRLAWREWPRHSSRQKATMLFGGLVGELRYCGPLEGFLPWLALAEYLHVGGKTTFGFGAVRVIPLP